MKKKKINRVFHLAWTEHLFSAVSDTADAWSFFQHFRELDTEFQTNVGYNSGVHIVCGRLIKKNTEAEVSCFCYSATVPLNIFSSSYIR
jgi:hypothetical protein